MQSATSRGRVLLVDDDLCIRRLLAEALALEGFAIEVASDASGAWDLIERSQPDLVVLDVMMPGGDGLSLLARLRATRRHHDLKVLLLTARAQQEDIERGLRAGADAYVTKPFSIEGLVWHLDELLHNEPTPTSSSRSEPLEPLERLRRHGPIPLADIVGRITTVAAPDAMGVA